MTRLAVVAPIVAVLAVAGCTPATERPDTGSAAPPAPAAAVSEPPAVEPATTEPANTEPTPAEPTSAEPAKADAVTPRKTTAAGRGCPVAADTLGAVPVPGYSGTQIEVVPSSIRCAGGWAQAEPASQGGDGVLLYRYDAGSRAWRFAIEGSSVDCAELGVPRAAGRRLSACYYP